MTSALRTAAPVDARARRRSHPRVMTPRSGARWLIVSLAALLVGCGDDVATTPANLAVDAGTDSGPARPRVRLLVDANRDGTVSDTGDDEAFRASWDAAHGAVFLANVDDDDDDDVLDGADDVVNGEADALDLARVRVAPIARPRRGGDRAARAHRPDDAGGAGVPRGRRRVAEHRPRGGDPVDRRPARGRRARRRVERLPHGDLGGRDHPEAGRDPRRRGARRRPRGDARGALRGEQLARRDRAGLRHHRRRVLPLRASSTTSTRSRPKTAWTSRPSTARPRLARARPRPRRLDPGLHGARVDRDARRRRPPRHERRAAHPEPDRAIAAWTRRDFVGPNRGYVWHHSARYPTARAHDPSLDSFGNLEVIPAYAGHPSGGSSTATSTPEAATPSCAPSSTPSGCRVRCWSSTPRGCTWATSTSSRASSR
jgi:hypothetical protein